MYPKTIFFLVKTVENICIIINLNTNAIQSNNTYIDSNKVKIVFMFDDGWESIYTQAYKIMKKYDYKASVSIIPSLVNESEYMSYKQLSELYLEGWDLLNHSYSHKENMYDKCYKLLLDFNKARQWMKNKFIGNHSDMIIMPYGEINPYLIELLKNAEYRNIRTADNIIILESDKIIYYPATIISLLTDVTVNEVKSILTQTFDNHKTVIFILHKIGNKDNGFGMTYSKDKLEQIVKFIDKHSDKFQVVTYSQLF
ncbi:polysaccharide deacetylase family protein [Caloranaerobacter ferrireducens]|uniref:polysaccharide deacetylase family protein n=1 Tax=Caloranaerobacter ferrireducens TaxID=1323370 RepID=UPI00241CE1B5|nr:polysaccharide deacetylase family protein [Caloranaerobacter ferrireducens]